MVVVAGGVGGVTAEVVGGVGIGVDAEEEEALVSRPLLRQ